MPRLGVSAFVFECNIVLYLHCVPRTGSALQIGGFDLSQWYKLYTPGGAGLSLVDNEDLVKHIAMQMLEVSKSCQHSVVCMSRIAE